MIGQTQPPRPATGSSIEVKAEPVPFDVLAGSVTALTRTDLDAGGARDTAEALRFVPSVHLSQSGTKGSLTTLSIRGGKPNFTLVLIDGIPANDIGDQLGGAFNFATLDTESIERIDIFRGPLSTLYGSEAIGGVVNVTLRRPEDGQHLHVGVEGGQFGYARADANGSWARDATGVEAGGSFSRIGQQVFADGSLLGTSNILVDRRFGATRSLEGFARWNRLSDTTLPVSSGGPLYALSRVPEQLMADQVSTGGVFSHTVSPKFSYDARGGIFSRVASDNAPAILDRVPPGPAYVPSSLSRTRFLRADGITTQVYTPLHWLSTYTSLSLSHEAGTARGTLAGYLPASYQLQRTTFNASGTVAASSKYGSLTAGLNVQSSTGFDAVLSPRGGGSLTLHGYNLHLSYGEGFKLPSFYALGNPLVGNPALVPETGRAYDAGVARSYRSDRTRVALTYFDDRNGNLIDFSPKLFKLVNRSSAFARGSDLEVTQQVGKLWLRGSVTYVDAGLFATTDRLRDVPRWSEALQARASLPKKCMMQVETTWAGRRYDYQVSVPAQTTVPRYTFTNLSVEKVLSPHTAGRVRIENAFNSRFQEFVGFPSPGISISGGVSYRR